MTLFLIGLFLGLILTAFVEHCDRAKAKLEGSLVDINDLQAGGNCGCCGKWVPDAIVERDWPWALCEECAKAGNPSVVVEFGDGQIVTIKEDKP